MTKHQVTTHLVVNEKESDNTQIVCVINLKKMDESKSENKESREEKIKEGNVSIQCNK